MKRLIAVVMNSFSAKLGVVAVTLTLTVLGLSAGSKVAHAVALNPDPGGGIVDYARQTLVDLPNGCSRSPGFSYWMSPWLTPSQALEQQPRINMQPGQTLPFQFNWVGAVCSSSSGVDTTIATLVPGPGASLPDNNPLVLDWRPGGINNIGNYQFAGKTYNWTAPTTGLAIGDNIRTITVSIRALNIFANGSYSCVRGGNPQNFLDTTNCNALTLSVDVNVFVPTPTYNVIGQKIDRYLNPNGEYQNATVKDNNTGETSNALVYNLGGRTINIDHTIQAWDSADWVATGWRLNFGPTGNANFYGFPANTVPANSKQNLDFFYEPRPSTIQQGILIKDPADGQYKNPCGLSGYLSQPCSASTQTTITKGFNLPGNLVNTYNQNPQTVTPVSPGADGGVVGVAGLYTGTYYTKLVSLPAGWKISRTLQCNENEDYKTCWKTPAISNTPATSFNISIGANRSRPVYFVLEPDTITIAGNKMGPNTFMPSQSSDVGTVPNGTISINGQVVSNTTATSQWSRTLNYDATNNGLYRVKADADTGWVIRGYAWCYAAATPNNCTNDSVQAANNQVQNNIILDGNGQTSYSVDIDYRGTTPTINGVSAGANKGIWITFFYKPKPIDVRVRAYIDQKGGDNKKLNPCDYSDYKKQICDQSRIRAVRMNTAGQLSNSQAPGRDLGDPAGAYGNCVSTDYIPTKPGYNYNNIGNYYCAKNDSGGVTQANGTPFISYGQTWDAYGGAGQNASPDENNAAIFRNLYPGKYSFQADGTPDTSSINGSMIPAPAVGVSSNPDLAYTVAHSTCSINTTKCQDTATVINDTGGCKLNHRRKAEALAQYFWGEWYPIIGVNGAYGWAGGTIASDGQDFCTIIWSGAPGNDSAPNFGSPEVWNPSFNWNASQPSRCTTNYFQAWNGNYGQYGTGVNANTNCGYQKVATRSVYTYSMGITPANLGVGNANLVREQNFLYTPNVKVSDKQSVIGCNGYTARVSYMPDPGRTVTSYFLIGNVPLTDGSGNVLTAQNRQAGVSDPFQINLTIPKYNGSGQILKDGNTRAFNHFARFPDSDLQTNYTQTQKDTQTNNVKYSATLVWKGNHVCQNNATCNISNAPASIDADDDSPYTLTVDVKNTGYSYWMQNITETDSWGISRLVASTNHGLMSAPGTQLGTPSGWTIQGFPAGSAGYSYMLALAAGTQVFPSSVDFGAIVTGNSSYQYRVTVVGPKDGGKQFRLGFQMAQNGVQFGSPCEVQIDVVNSYKPWLRVQNGDTSALGKVYNQPDGAKGTYKSNKVPQDPPSSGIPPEQPQPAVPFANNDINLQAAYVVYGAVTGNSTPGLAENRFCSANAYNFGRGTTGAYNYKSDGCSLGAYRFRLPSDVQQNLQADSSTNSTDKLYDSALDSYNTKGGCDDTNSNTPDEVPSAAKMYRQGNNGVPLTGSNFAELPRMGGPGQGAISLVTVENSGNSPVKKPCPTIYRWDAGPTGVLSDPSGTLKIGAGRATVIVDTVKNGPGKLTINSNILNQIGALSFQLNSGGYATASMNQLPNLGIIVKGDVVIDKSVTEINASIYATGTISTCDKYDNGLDDTTTGTAAPRKNKITLNNQPKLPPYEDNADAKQCSNKLVVKGSLVAGDGFKFGRNYVDFLGMSNNMNKLTVPSNWGPQAPNYDNYAGFPEYNLFQWPGDPSRNKFCSTDPGYRCKADHWGAYHDFDAPGFINRVSYLGCPACNSGNPYNLLNFTGYPQAGYTSDPAEDIVGNGLSLMFAPPGFDNLGSDDFVNAKFVDNSSSPKF